VWIRPAHWCRFVSLLLWKISYFRMWIMSDAGGILIYLYFPVSEWRRTAEQCQESLWGWSGKGSGIKRIFLRILYSYNFFPYKCHWINYKQLLVNGLGTELQRKKIVTLLYCRFISYIVVTTWAWHHELWPFTTCSTVQEFDPYLVATKQSTETELLLPCRPRPFWQSDLSTVLQMKVSSKVIALWQLI